MTAQDGPFSGTKTMPLSKTSYYNWSLASVYLFQNYSAVYGPISTILSYYNLTLVGAVESQGGTLLARR